MMRFRLTVALLLVVMLAFFATTEVDGFGWSTALPSAVPLAGVFAVALTLLVGATPYQPPLLAVGYALSRMAWSPPRGQSAGSIPTLAVETVLLMLALYLAVRLVHTSSHYQHIIEDVTLHGHANRIRAVHESSAEIDRELLRSRQYERPLSVVVVRVESSALAAEELRLRDEIIDTIARRHVIGGLAQRILRSVRRTDIVMEQRDQGQLVILCPETPAEGSAALAGQIERTALTLGLRVRCGAAAFPNDGPTFEALLRMATPAADRPDLVPDIHHVCETEAGCEVLTGAVFAASDRREG